MERDQTLRVAADDVQNAQHHPSFVHIPSAGTEGVRSYKEPGTPHPLQVDWLDKANENAYIARLQQLLTLGQFGEAAKILEADLDGFDGRISRLAKACRVEDIGFEGWDDLAEIIAEFEGPPISCITAGLGNEPDLVFAGGKEHEPVLLFNLYSDDMFDFSTRTDEELIEACADECPGWTGHEEDVEFYVGLEGLAPLNTALIQCKHQHFLRDGRDGVEGRAPGGYVEYQLGCWLRATRFLQAIRREVKTHGLPEGVRLITGTVGLNADLATVIGTRRRVVIDREAANRKTAALTMSEWVPKHDPLADMETGTSLRQRIRQDDRSEADHPDGEPCVSEDPVPQAPPATPPWTPAVDLPPSFAAAIEKAQQSAPVAETAPARPRGFFAKLFERRRKR